MVVCTAGSKRAKFSPAGKIMHQSHSATLFLWHSSSSVASHTSSRLTWPSTCFFFLALSSQLALHTSRDLIYPVTIGRYPGALKLWTPLRVPFPKKMCTTSFILTTLFLNPGVSLLALGVFWHHYGPDLLSHNSCQDRGGVGRTPGGPPVLGSRREGIGQKKYSIALISRPMDRRSLKYSL